MVMLVNLFRIIREDKIFLCFLSVLLLTAILKYENLHDNRTSHPQHLRPLTNAKNILTWDYFYLFYNLTDPIYKSLNCSTNCTYTKYQPNMNVEFFDAVIFTEKDTGCDRIPKKRYRYSQQIYIYTNIESPSNSPVCETCNDGLYNLSFTYRLDSDVFFRMFAFRNLSGHVVAPSPHVKWEVSPGPIRPEIRSILSRKKKLGAWLVSNCDTSSSREEYLTKLQEHLYHYGLSIDVYGRCSKMNCKNGDCNEMIKNEYLFYMAFENSFAKDYVTEKILHGYENYAVPIVYGGANYSKFLPLGSYINAGEIHPYNLAFLLYQVISNPSSIEKYFKWTNLYTIDNYFYWVKPELTRYRYETTHYDVHPLCELCNTLHDEAKVTNIPAKEKFRIWFNGLNGMRWCLNRNSLLDMFRINNDFNP